MRSKILTKLYPRVEIWEPDQINKHDSASLLQIGRHQSTSSNAGEKRQSPAEKVTTKQDKTSLMGGLASPAVDILELRCTWPMWIYCCSPSIRWFVAGDLLLGLSIDLTGRHPMVCNGLFKEACWLSRRRRRRGEVWWNVNGEPPGSIIW